MLMQKIPHFSYTSTFLNFSEHRFLSFGGAVPYRPAEDLAFAVARFFQRGGTFQNYYMVLYKFLTKRRDFTFLIYQYFVCNDS